jgi:hypothetical protein
MGYLWARFGDAFLFYSAQEYWGRRATGPLATLTGALSSAVEAGGKLLDPGLWADPTLGNLANHLAQMGNFTNLAFFVFAAAVLLAGSRHLPISLTLYGLSCSSPPRHALRDVPEPADGHPALHTGRVPHLYGDGSPVQE